MDIIKRLPYDVMGYIYTFLPNGYLDKLERRRRNIRKAIGTYFPYGDRKTIYNMKTQDAVDQFRVLKCQYYMLTMKMWKYATDHHCIRCMRQHIDKKNMISCSKCGRCVCRFQYTTLNKKYGYNAIKTGMLIKKPFYACPYCVSKEKILLFMSNDDDKLNLIFTLYEQSYRQSFV